MPREPRRKGPAYGCPHSLALSLASRARPRNPIARRMPPSIAPRGLPRLTIVGGSPAAARWNLRSRGSMLPCIAIALRCPWRLSAVHSATTVRHRWWHGLWPRSASGTQMHRQRVLHPICACPPYCAGVFNIFDKPTGGCLRISGAVASTFGVQRS